MIERHQRMTVRGPYRVGACLAAVIVSTINLARGDLSYLTAAIEYATIVVCTGGIVTEVRDMFDRKGRQ